jgi:hypothetical protein
LEDAYGNGYVLVLNRDYETEANVFLPLKADYRIYEVSKEDGRQHLLQNEATALCALLAPGDARLFRLQSTKEEAFTAEYELA